jgi:hypothetical protein
MTRRFVRFRRTYLQLASEAGHVSHMRRVAGLFFFRLAQTITLNTALYADHFHTRRTGLR